MAGCKVVTRKLITWYGRDEEFSNVYFFGDGDLGLSPSESDATSLINAVIDAEQAVCATVVRFLGGAAYKIGAADTPGRTDAISVVELPASGENGISNETAAMYRECAIDIKWLLGGRRYLRTLLHTCSAHGYATNGATATATATIGAPVKTYADKMLNGPWPGGMQRIAPNGDRPTVVQYNPYLEHRQFHRYRKRNAGLLG